MSERKTAEIKFRIEPSVKAGWQADADAKGVSLSALIVETMSARTDRVASDEKLATLRDSAIALALGTTQPCKRDDVSFDGCTECGGSNTELGKGCGFVYGITDLSPRDGEPLAAPQADVTLATRSVGTSDEVGANQDSIIIEPLECDCGQVHTTHFDFGISNEGHSVACPANPALHREPPPKSWMFEAQNG